MYSIHQSLLHHDHLLEPSNSCVFPVVVPQAFFSSQIMYLAVLCKSLVISNYCNPL